MRYFNETFKTDSRFILQTLVNLTLKISLRIFLKKILRTTWSKETNRSLKHMKTVRRQQEKKLKLNLKGKKDHLHILVEYQEVYKKQGCKNRP